MTKQLEQLTEFDKCLLIAKAIYGTLNVQALNGCVLYRKLAFDRFSLFNPYTNAEDSQAVQDRFKLDTAYLPEKQQWLAMESSFTWVVEEKNTDTYNKDLKTAVANCACLVILEK